LTHIAYTDAIQLFTFAAVHVNSTHIVCIFHIVS